jgi:hypothetical protein
MIFEAERILLDDVLALFIPELFSGIVVPFSFFNDPLFSYFSKFIFS